MAATTRITIIASNYRTSNIARPRDNNEVYPQEFPNNSLHLRLGMPNNIARKHEYILNKSPLNCSCISEKWKSLYKYELQLRIAEKLNYFINIKRKLLFHLPSTFHVRYCRDTVSKRSDIKKNIYIYIPTCIKDKKICTILF